MSQKKIWKGCHRTGLPDVIPVQEAQGLKKSFSAAIMRQTPGYFRKQRIYIHRL